MGVPRLTEEQQGGWEKHPVEGRRVRERNMAKEAGRSRSGGERKMQGLRQGRLGPGGLSRMRSGRQKCCVRKASGQLPMGQVIMETDVPAWAWDR